MNENLKFVIEIVVTFIVALIYYYFALIRQHKKLDSKKVPQEVNIILRFHKIDLTKINYKKMLIILAIITSLILSVALNVVFHFMNNNILIVIITLVVALPITLMAYDMVGRYFEKKSNEKIEEEKENKKKK